MAGVDTTTYTYRPGWIPSPSIINTWPMYTPEHMGSLEGFELYQPRDRLASKRFR